MADKPLVCRLGFHSYVQRHPVDERSHGPDQKACRRCRKQITDVGGVPGIFFSGGGGGAVG
jgi:hypothetical protein